MKPPQREALTLQIESSPCSPPLERAAANTQCSWKKKKVIDLEQWGCLSQTGEISGKKTGDRDVHFLKKEYILFGCIGS